MAVLINLHVVASANPSTVLYFFILVRVKPARAERAPNFVYVLGESKYYLVGNAFNGRYGSSWLLAIFFDKDAHALDRFFVWLVRHFVSCLAQRPFNRKFELRFCLIERGDDYAMLTFCVEFNTVVKTSMSWILRCFDNGFAHSSSL